MSVSAKPLRGGPGEEMVVPTEEDEETVSQSLTPRFKLAAKGPEDKDEDQLQKVFLSMLMEAVEAVRKEQQGQMDALRRELEAHQKSSTTALEDRLTRRAAEEREELDSLLTDWYAQTTQTQQEQGDVIEQLRGIVATGAPPGEGGKDAAEKEDGSANSTQVAVGALREELLALRAEDMQALQEAISFLSVEVTKALQNDRGGKGDAGSEQLGAIAERLASLEAACNEMEGLSAQHEGLIQEAKSSTKQVQLDVARLAEELVEFQQRIGDPKEGAAAGRGAQELQALSEQAAQLAVRPVAERLAAAEDALSTLQANPTDTSGDVEALAVALEEARARAEGDASLLTQEVEEDRRRADAARLEARRAVDRVKSDVCNLAEEVAAFRLRLQAVEEGATKVAEVQLAGRGDGELGTPGCDQVKAWSAEAFHESAGQLAERVKVLEDALPGINGSLVEVKGLALSADRGLRELGAETQRQQQATEKQVACLEGSVRDTPGQEAVKAWSAEVLRGVSEELLQRMQALEEKVPTLPTPALDMSTKTGIASPMSQTEPRLERGEVLTAQRVRELAAEVMQDIARKLQASHNGDVAELRAALEDMRAQVGGGDVAVELQAAASSAIEELRIRMHAFEGQDFMERVENLEAVLRHLAGAAEAGDVKGTSVALEAAFDRLAHSGAGSTAAFDRLAHSGAGSTTAQGLSSEKEEPRPEEIQGDVTAQPPTTVFAPSTCSATCIASAVTTATPGVPRTSPPAAPTMKVGATVHCGALEQPETLRERLQGLVDMVKSAVHAPDSPTGARRSLSTAAARAQIAGLQTCHIDTRADAEQPGGHSCNKPSGVKTCAAVRNASAHISPRWSVSTTAAPSGGVATTKHFSAGMGSPLPMRTTRQASPSPSRRVLQVPPVMMGTTMQVRNMSRAAMHGCNVGSFVASPKGSMESLVQPMAPVVMGGGAPAARLPVQAVQAPYQATHAWSRAAGRA